MIYHSQFEQFEREAAAGNPPWLAAMRRAAMQRFAELGFPTTRDEGWRYTNVAPLAKVPFKLSRGNGNGLTARSLVQYLFNEIPCCNLVFVNGAYSGALSSLCPLPEAVRVGNLARFASQAPDELEPHLGRGAARQERAFTALNTAFLGDGAFVSVPPGLGLEPVIHLLYISLTANEAIMSHPRSLIVLGRESRIRVVESYIGLRDDVYLTNAVTEMVLGEGARAEHYRLQRESESAYHISAMYVRQERDSNVACHSVSLGGGLARNELRVLLDGEGAETSLMGLYLTRGRQHADNQIEVEHARPYCSSRQVYKGILDDSSTGAFGGKIVVRRDAQRTDARQTNKNLLLSDQAVVDTKPQLEIHADDVKCTHGATIGKLDEEALFYLRSRGISRDAARTILTYAFASEVLGSMKVKPIQCQTDLNLLNRLSRDPQAKEAS